MLAYENEERVCVGVHTHTQTCMRKRKTERNREVFLLSCIKQQPLLCLFHSSVIYAHAK